MREKFQVLVILFIYPSELTVAIFQRSDDSNWQFIAGGGEDGESLIEAAKRESYEEAGIEPTYEFIQLDTVSSIPMEHFPHVKDQTGLWVIPEYCFAVKVETQSLNISSEHTSVKWVIYDEAISSLKYDSNKTALWELRQRIISVST